MFFSFVSVNNLLTHITGADFKIANLSCIKSDSVYKLIYVPFILIHFI